MRKGITRRGALGGALAGAAAAEANARILPRGLGAGVVAPPPTPTAVTLTPSSAVLVDTATVPATLCSIAVTMSDGSTFTGSLTENNTNTSISGTTSLRLDTMPADGAVGVLVSATQNSVTVSSTFSLTVTAPGAAINFVTGPPEVLGSQGPTSSFRGTHIVVNNTNDVIVSALGRRMVTGNNGAFTIKIVDAATSIDIPGGSVTLNLSAANSIGTFYYTNLASPITLGVAQGYYIVANSPGGDQEVDHIPHTTAATIPESIQFDNGVSYQPGGGGNEGCHGPLDFKYTLGAIVNIGSPLAAPTRTAGENRLLLGGIGGSFPYSGTVTFDAEYSGINVPPTNSVVVQYEVRGPGGFVLDSPYISGPVDGTTRLTPNYPWTVNTAAWPNGTHHINVRWVDTNPSLGTAPAYDQRAYPLVALVQNPAGTGVASYSGAQQVPTGILTTIQPMGATSLTPSFINYPGSVPTVNAYPHPVVRVNPTSDPAHRGGVGYIEDLGSKCSGEFVLIPHWATSPSGGIYIDYASVDTGGGNIDDFYPQAFRSQTQPGELGQSWNTPISNFIAAEGTDPTYGSDTGYIGVELRGSLIHLAWNGTVTLLAGISWDPSKPGFNNMQIRSIPVPESIVMTQCQVVGTIAAAPNDFAPDAFGGLNDVCYDPRDPTGKTIYVTNAVDSFIIKVDRNFTPPHCSRYAGGEDIQGYHNDAVAVNAIFNRPSSIVCCDGTVAGFPAGTMLVADQFNAAIRRIAPASLSLPGGGAVDTLCGNQTSKPTNAQLMTPAISDTWSPPGSVGFTAGNDSVGAYISPFVLRFASAPAGVGTARNVLVAYEMYTNTLRIVNLSASTITRIPNTKGMVGLGTPPTDTPYDGWFWISVDAFGVFGPKDDIVCGASVGAVAHNEVYFRVSLDGSYIGTWIGDHSGYVPEGGTGVMGVPGVYAWVNAFSTTRAHWLGGGFRIWGVYGTRPAAAGDPSGLDLAVFTQASNSQNFGIWWSGTTLCFPLGTKPSLASIYGEFGNSVLGSSVVPTFDDLNALYPTDGSFTAAVCAPGTLGRFLQDGSPGWGIVPTPLPELTGNDLRAVCYYIRRLTRAGLWPTPVLPGPLNLDASVPRISGVTAAQISNDSLGHRRITVSWTCNKLAIGMAVAGSPAQFASSYKYNVFSPLETGFVAAGATHTVTISGLPPVVTTIHYCVIVKDVPGNSSYSTDQTITIT